jgi:hypothetical protein
MLSQSMSSGQRSEAGTALPSPTTNASGAAASNLQTNVLSGSPTGTQLPVAQAVAPPSRPPPPPPLVPGHDGGSGLAIGAGGASGASASGSGVIGGSGGLLVSFSPATMALVSAAGTGTAGFGGTEGGGAPGPSSSSLPPELEALLKTSVRDLTASMKSQASPPPKFQFFEGPAPAPAPQSGPGGLGAASTGPDTFVIP